MAMNLAYDVALEAAHYLAPCFAFCGSSGYIGFGFFVVSHTDDGYPIEGRIGLAIAPRFRRMRFVLPLDAGIGQTPHSFAKAASDLIRSGLSPTRISISATVCVEMPCDFISSGAFSRAICSSSTSWAWISSCKASHRRASARIAHLADAVGEAISPGLRAAMCRIRLIGPLIWSRVSRSSAGALMIIVFKVIIACDLAFTALSRTILMCRIISDDPVCVLAKALA